jgi:hypothetical protein
MITNNSYDNVDIQRTFSLIFDRIKYDLSDLALSAFVKHIKPICDLYDFRFSTLFGEWEFAELCDDGKWCVVSKDDHRIKSIVWVLDMKPERFGSDLNVTLGTFMPDYDPEYKHEWKV